MIEATKPQSKTFPREKWSEDLNQKNFVRPNFERVSRVSWARVHVIDLNIIYCGHPHLPTYTKELVPGKF